MPAIEAYRMLRSLASGDRAITLPLQGSLAS
jgi:hypothetical protein